MQVRQEMPSLAGSGAQDPTSFLRVGASEMRPEDASESQSPGAASAACTHACRHARPRVNLRARVVKYCWRSEHHCASSSGAGDVRAPIRQQHSSPPAAAAARAAHGRAAAAHGAAARQRAGHGRSRHARGGGFGDRQAGGGSTEPARGASTGGRGCPGRGHRSKTTSLSTNRTKEERPSAAPERERERERETLGGRSARRRSGGLVSELLASRSDLGSSCAYLPRLIHRTC